MRRQSRDGRANSALRQQVHRALIATGWAERISQASFRLLRPPTDVTGAEFDDVQALARAPGHPYVATRIARIWLTGASDRVQSTNRIGLPANAATTWLASLLRTSE